MAAPLEIPLTLIGQNGGFVGIAPAARYDRLPASHTVAIDNILLDKLHQSLAQWMIAPANPVANLRNLLQQIGGNIFAPTNETLTRLLKLDDQTLGQWRRILIYTDSDASTIPVEVLWSGEQFNGNALG